MKKLYFLFLMCFISILAHAQQTIVVYDTAAFGTYKSGYCSMTFRFDDTIKSGDSPDQFRGWAVFDLATLPPNSTVTNIEFGYYLIDSSVAATVYGNWQTYGIGSDISGVTSPTALLPALAAGVPLWNNSYSNGSSPFPGLGNRTMIGNTGHPAALFVQGQAGNKISISVSGGAGVTYRIMGESGVRSMTANYHCPYLKITYTCLGLTTVSANAAPSPLCEFTPLTLTAFAPGASSYSWTGPKNFTTTGNPASALADTTGFYIALARNSIGCFYRDTTPLITVWDAPDAKITNLSDSTFCTGGSVVLDATTPTVATDTFEWFLNGTPIPGETNPTYTATATGNYHVRVTNALGCKNTSRPMQVLALAAPTINPGGIIKACTGGGILLTLNTGGGIGGLDFQWKSGSSNIPGATNSSYSATISGTYSAVVRVVSDPSCVYNVVPSVVNLFPIPNPVITNGGGTLSTPNMYASYQWYRNSVAVPGATSYVYTPTLNGLYNLRITDDKGCSNYSNSIAIGAAGVREVGAVAVAIYPNPAKNIVKIEAPVAVRVVVCGMEGKTIMQKENATELNISHLPDGMYLIYVYGEDGKKLAVEKLVKQ